MKTTIAILFPWFSIEAKPEMNNNHKDSQLEIDFNKKEENKNTIDLEKYNKKELIQRCNELRKMYNETAIKHDEILKKYKYDIEYHKKIEEENKKLNFDIQYKNSIINTQKETIENLSKNLESSRYDRLTAIKVLNEIINEQNKTINEQNETINEFRNYISSLCTIQYGIHAT